MDHDDGLSDVGLDNGWYSFDRRAGRCDREASQKVIQNLCKKRVTLDWTPMCTVIALK
jgi:hypothetical protein